jgi:predicted AAA+ superfamily ATPase
MLQDLQEHLFPGKVCVLYGPRQVGKTTLVKALKESSPLKTLFITADDINYREILSSQSIARLSELAGDSELLIIDEAQRVENIGLNLKILVDNHPDLKIVATGSASFELANKVNEPLTGRKITYTLYPVSYYELQQTYGKIETRSQLERWMIWGGYPEIVLSGDRTQRETLITELVNSFLYRDILEMEDIRHSKKITDLLRLLAFQIGSEVSISELGKSLAADFRTVQRYLDLLEKSFVIFRVGGFSRNLRKEVTKNDRYYFFDNGVRNALIQNFNGISLRNDVGMLWENYLMVERLKTNQRMHRFVNTYFWRTYDQKELDCVEEHEGKLFGYEFKFTNGNIRKTTRQEFLQSYPQSELTCISRENYEAFIS